MSTQAEPKSQSTLMALKTLVIKVTRLKIAPADIRDNANLFDDCGMDSTIVVDFVFEIEDVFGISIPEEEMDAELFQNIGKFAEFIDLKLAAKKAEVQ